jgi:hypothetical protein
MKKLLPLGLLAALSFSVAGQKLPEWYRVYTFEESAIDMNTATPILGGDIGRIQFRWVFDKPEALVGQPHLQVKTRLETIEFKCTDQKYRVFELILLDSSGKVLRSELMDSPYEWRPIHLNTVMSTISIPACDLINRELKALDPQPISDVETESKKTGEFAIAFVQSLEHSKDFKPIIQKFFAPNYLNGYLHDSETNWFLNLNRDVATKASRAELQRYYVAILNAAYLSSSYLMSQSSSIDEASSDVSALEEKLVPLDVIQMVRNHPYTASYKGKAETYDYLAENIDSVDRMRSYTDLMERVAALIRSHLMRVKDHQSVFYEKSELDQNTRVCATECLGLPKGTRLIEISLPIFKLQLAAFHGQLKIVSISDRSTKSNH